MKVESLQDLKKLLDLCRKAGVATLKLDGIEFALSEPMAEFKSNKRQRQSKQQAASSSIVSPFSPPTIIPGDIDLTEEQLLMWSVDEMPDLEQN